MPGRFRRPVPGRGSPCTEPPTRPRSGDARSRCASARRARRRRTARTPSGYSPRRPLAACALEVVVRGQRLADLLGQRFCGKTRLVALGPELLHGDVARGPDLGARNDPCGSVLVPDPDVIHLQVEERIVRLRDLREIELVAEVRGVLGEDAVAEEADDGGVLLLQLQLELGLELVELVEVTHPDESSLASRDCTEPWPGTSRSGSSSASGSSANRRSCRRGCGTLRNGSSMVASP